MAEDTKDDVLTGDAGAAAASGTPQRVPVNMYETTDAVVIVAAMPAVMADDIRVGIDGRTLTIHADRRTAAPKDYLLHEWHYGPYERSVELPEGFGGEAEGTLANGQLALRVTRGDDAAPRQVPITGKH